jgi:predicted nucleic acid-binding protein
VKLFLDASVLLTACGRPAGGSHAVCDLAARQGWRLLTSNYVVQETEKNVRLRLPSETQGEWKRLKPLLEMMTDVVTFDWPVVFPAAKNRPVLFTAAATADVLRTLDRADFGPVMAAGFYGLPVMRPGDFLRRERAAGRLSVA